MTDTLVIYYSFTGNSKKVAEYVKDKLNADILELEPVIPFSDDYDTVVEEWQNNNIKRDVEVKEVNKDLANYKNSFNYLYLVVWNQPCHEKVFKRV